MAGDSGNIINPFLPVMRGAQPDPEWTAGNTDPSSIDPALLQGANPFTQSVAAAPAPAPAPQPVPVAAPAVGGMVNPFTPGQGGVPVSTDTASDPNVVPGYTPSPGNPYTPAGAAPSPSAVSPTSTAAPTGSVNPFTGLAAPALPNLTPAPTHDMAAQAKGSIIPAILGLVLGGALGHGRGAAIGLSSALGGFNQGADAAFDAKAGQVAGDNANAVSTFKMQGDQFGQNLDLANANAGQQRFDATQAGDKADRDAAAAHQAALDALAAAKVRDDATKGDTEFAYNIKDPGAQASYLSMPQHAGALTAWPKDANGKPLWVPSFQPKDTSAADDTTKRQALTQLTAMNNEDPRWKTQLASQYPSDTGAQARALIQRNNLKEHLANVAGVPFTADPVPGVKNPYVAGGFNPRVPLSTEDQARIAGQQETVKQHATEDSLRSRELGIQEGNQGLAKDRFTFETEQAHLKQLTAGGKAAKPADVPTLESRALEIQGKKNPYAAPPDPDDIDPLSDYGKFETRRTSTVVAYQKAIGEAKATAAAAPAHHSATQPRNPAGQFNGAPASGKAASGNTFVIHN